MKQKRIFTLFAWVSIAFLVAIGSSQIAAIPPLAAQQPQATLTVSAGAALQKALQEIQQTYSQSQPNTTITYNFGSSGSLQQQIEQGADVDIFISVAAHYMNELQDKGMLLNDTRRNLLSDGVALIVPKNSSAKIESFQDLASDRVKRIAIGEPRSVPLGKYAEEILTYFQILDKVKPKLVYARDGMQIQGYVETGNVDAGIAHESSAKESDRVTIVAIAPEKSHSPVVIPIAILKNSKNAPAAEDFVEFLFSDRAKAIFEQYGYKMANQSTPLGNSKL